MALALELGVRGRVSVGMRYRVYQGGLGQELWDCAAIQVHSLVFVNGDNNSIALLFYLCYECCQLQQAFIPWAWWCQPTVANNRLLLYKHCVVVIEATCQFL